VKVPKPEALLARTTLCDFFFEAEVQMPLPSHPHLPHVVGVCLDHEHPAIIFDLIEGWSLGEMLVGIGSMVPYCRFVLQCAVQVVSALCHLHENEIVHRDVALRNVMITRELVVKLLDFGLAQYGDETIRFSARANESIPMRWAPPETFITTTVATDAECAAKRGVPFSTKTDSWAVGVLLWEMFTLSMPYGLFSGIEDLRHRICVERRRLERPPQCPNLVYERVMIPLFVADPNRRPSMLEIKEQLCALLRELEAGGDLGGLEPRRTDTLVDPMLLEKIYLEL